MNFGIHIGAMGGPLDEMRELWKFADAKGFVSIALRDGPYDWEALEAFAAEFIH
jgi:hypothetical protein